jgi:UDP-glucose 4-epimerase
MILNSGNTLVIGGGGYVGACLVPQLIASGRQVTVLGRSETPRYTLPSEVSYVAGDFADPELIRRLLDCHSEVIHLAYATVPNTAFHDPLSDLVQNLTPAVQLFTEAAARSVKLLLVSSGGTVYGEATELPIRECHVTRPISPYGVTKLTVENYAALSGATQGLNFVCVRPANAYGPGQRPFVGQGFIATAIASIMRGQPVSIFGQHGTVRDYLYVGDLAAGIVCALENGRRAEIYNLGSGIGMSNMEVINACMPMLADSGYQIQVNNLPERAFDVSANILDSTKLSKHTGWQCEVELSEGLLRTYEWLRATQQ